MLVESKEMMDFDFDDDELSAYLDEEMGRQKSRA